MRSFSTFFAAIAIGMSLVTQVACQSESQDPAVRNITEQLKGIFRSACDPQCCGQPNDGRNSSLPCCQSCGNIVDFQKLDGVPFAIPERKLKGHLSFKIAPLIKDAEPAVLDGLVSEYMFENLGFGYYLLAINGCHNDRGAVTGRCCKPRNVWVGDSVPFNQRVDCDIGPANLTAPHDPYDPVESLPPTLIEDAEGNWRFISQTQDRTELNTEQGCYCEGEGFTTTCRDGCVLNRHKLPPRNRRDEL